MAKVPNVGDVQKMFTRASLAAMVCYTGTLFAATIFAITLAKPEYASNPIGGAIMGVVLLALAVAFNVVHLSSKRRKRTVMNVLQKENGKTYLEVRYMDGKTETVLADGAH